jgi:hypothetical protein
MGVEYAHGIFVADLMWRPTWPQVRAVSDVLHSAGFRRKTRLEVLRDVPANLTIVHAGIEGPRVREIVGPSHYEGIADTDRYIQDAVAVFGVDLKKPLTEEYGGDVIATPGPPPDDPPDCGAKMQFVYPATWETPLPRMRRPGLFWRSGIVIDCGKDVPAIADDDRRLPNRALLRQLEAAFETSLIELGWIY